MSILVPVPLPAGHDALSIVFSSRERESEYDPVREPAFVRRKGPATGDEFPWREQVLRSGEWGSSVRLGVGTSSVEGSGGGAYRGRELWWVSHSGLPKNQRLGGWPVKLQLSRSCAANPGVCSAAVSLETRRDERSEIDNKPKAKRVETSCGSPPKGGGRL